MPIVEFFFVNKCVRHRVSVCTNHHMDGWMDESNQELKVIPGIATRPRGVSFDRIL